MKNTLIKMAHISAFKRLSAVLNYLIKLLMKVVFNEGFSFCQREWGWNDKCTSWQ